MGVTATTSAVSVTELAKNLTSWQSGRLCTKVAPPSAEPRAHSEQHHGVQLTDDWHWLKDPNYPKATSEPILNYLKAENAYFDAVLRQEHKGFIDDLYTELKARQTDTDLGVPYGDGDYYYQWRFAAGAQYKTWWRKPRNTALAPAAASSDWQLILDEPALAAEHESFVLGGFSVSPCGQYLAYATDSEGAERYLITIKDLHTNLLLDTYIDNTEGTPRFSADGTRLIYVALSDKWRPYQVKAHSLQHPNQADAVLFEEQRDSFFVHLSESTSREWLIISSGDHETNEVRLLPANNPQVEPQLLAPRVDSRRFDVDHGGGRFWIRTNDQHQNYRLLSATSSTEPAAKWREEIPALDEVYLLEVRSFKDFYLTLERRLGIDTVWVHQYEGGAHQVRFPEELSHTELGRNCDYDTTSVHLKYSSLTTTASVFNYTPASRQLDVLKVQQIPGGYDSNAYTSKRLWVTARDGTKVPVSLVYTKNMSLDGSNKLYLYGYGAYGYTVPPTFRLNWLSLLERGFVCAIAHIRGGTDLGYQWYERGKREQRTNTFNDFIDVAKRLIASNYTSAGRIAIAGGSAGGELMGAVVNQEPQLWGAVVAQVPFVDVLNTMLDENLPLTPMEWPEWGNPISDPKAYELIQSYSPYDQTKAQDYPPMFVTGGLNDPRVTYWEPAKWVAKLRWLKTDSNILLLKTELAAGHQGVSGRFDSLREQAEVWAFILLAMEQHAT